MTEQPLLEATQVEIERTEQERDERIEQITKAYDAQLERLREIAEKAAELQPVEVDVQSNGGTAGERTARQRPERKPPAQRAKTPAAGARGLTEHRSAEARSASIQSRKAKSEAKLQEAKDRIMQWANARPEEWKPKDARAQLGMSSGLWNNAIKALLAEGNLDRTGSTRGPMVRYRSRSAPQPPEGSDRPT